VNAAPIIRVVPEVIPRDGDASAVHVRKVRPTPARRSALTPLIRRIANATKEALGWPKFLIPKGPFQHISVTGRQLAAFRQQCRCEGLRRLQCTESCA
jgi:hypothetical protein